MDLYGIVGECTNTTYTNSKKEIIMISKEMYDVDVEIDSGSTNDSWANYGTSPSFTKEDVEMHAINCVVRKLRDDYKKRIEEMEIKYNEGVLAISTEINELKQLIEDDHDKGSTSVVMMSIDRYDNKENEEIKKIKEWLRDEVGLEGYIDNFVMNGFDSLSMIKEINDKKDLEYIGIIVNAHQIKIMNGITKLTQSII